MIKALEELYKLVPASKHAELDTWTSKWLKMVQKKQDFISNARINSETHDLICENLAQQCVMDLMDENLVKLTKYKNMYTLDMVVVRKKSEK